ncbi:ATP-binding protein [Gramella sp. KN1008]|uniref:ATP-binding protein n=1 Tax=Gramella sp. KN1008 TaxID=2529298 RepID=UPI0013F14B23|nr:ATP-binding protein [Gramella sp. KN1008]
MNNSNQYFSQVMISSENFNDHFRVNSSCEFQSGELSSSPRSLFLIIQTMDNKISYCNPAFKEYCGYGDTCMNSLKICKEIMHPEDQSNYFKHLKSFRNINNTKEKYIVVRLKNQHGEWSPFCFKDRIYTGHPSQKKLILTEVFALHESAESDTDSQQSLSLEYRHLLQSLDEAFCIFEMIYDENGYPVDYIFQEINPAFEKQINLKNVTGKTMRELIPDHEEHWFKTYGNVALTGEPIRFQYQAGKIDNAWLDLYAFRLGDNNSRRVAVLFHNITSRKLAEDQMKKVKADLERKAKKRQKELEESNALLKTIFNTTTLGIAVLKPLHNEKGEITDFRFVKTNNVLLKIFPKAGTKGATFFDATRDKPSLGIFNELKEVSKTGKDFDKELSFNQEGYNNWFRITALPQGDLLIATIENITERKLKDKELKETVRFKQQLVRTSPETIVIINLNDQNVRYINKDIYPKEGLTRKRVLGTPLPEIIPYIHPRDRERVLDFHRKILKSGDDEIHDIEIKLQLRPNKWEWFSVRGKVFHRRDDSWVDEYVLLIRNIHQQKKTQKALITAEKFSIMGEIARTLAHELRNPITSIGMATQVMGKKLDHIPHHGLDKYLKILKNSASILNELVSDLLNSSNYYESVLEKQDLTEIVESTLEKASDRIYLAGIEIKKDYEGHHYILADREKLEIALLNIILNASEATIPDEGIISVKITEEEKDILLFIGDNGHGLEKKQMDRLFDAFYTTKETGVGVGLYSVKNILEEHDSRIEVSSEPEKGTCFTIYFPKVT